MITLLTLIYSGTELKRTGRCSEISSESNPAVMGTRFAIFDILNGLQRFPHALVSINQSEETIRNNGRRI